MSRRIWLFGPLILVLAVAALLAVRGHWQAAPRPSLTDQYRKVHVEVLNGCGEEGAAKQVGHRLRNLGFDVMTIGNARTFNYPESIVIDRLGKPGYARMVAEALDVHNRIQQLVADPFRIEEVTVIVGRDYKRLVQPSPR